MALPAEATSFETEGIKALESWLHDEIGLKRSIGARTPELTHLIPESQISLVNVIERFRALPKQDTLLALAMLDQWVRRDTLSGDRSIQYDLALHFPTERNLATLLSSVLLHRPDAILFDEKQLVSATILAARHCDVGSYPVDPNKLLIILIIINSLLADHDIAMEKPAIHITSMYQEIRDIATSWATGPVMLARLAKFAVHLESRFGASFKENFAQANLWGVDEYLALAVVTQFKFGASRRGKQFDRTVDLLDCQASPDLEVFDRYRYPDWLKSMSYKPSDAPDSIPPSEVEQIALIRSPLFESSPGRFACLSRACLEAFAGDGVFYAMQRALNQLGCRSERIFQEFGQFMEERIRDHFIAAWPTGANVGGDHVEKGACDVIFADTDTLYLIEIHVHRVAREFIERPPNESELAKILEDLIFKKIRQLDNHVRDYAAGVLMGIGEIKSGLKIVPVLVTLNPCSTFPVLQDIVRRYISDNALLSNTEKLILLSAEDAEILPSLAQGGCMFTDIAMKRDQVSHGGLMKWGNTVLAYFKPQYVAAADDIIRRTLESQTMETRSIIAEFGFNTKS